MLSVELCSLTLQREDLSIPNLIASGLFGDGAAAAAARQRVPVPHSQPVSGRSTRTGFGAARAVSLRLFVQARRGASGGLPDVRRRIEHAFERRRGDLGVGIGEQVPAARG